MRFMEWQSTNGSQIQTVEQMPTAATFAQYIKNKTYDKGWHTTNAKGQQVPVFQGVPLEMIKAFCKTSGQPNKIPWVCIPHLADNALIYYIIKEMLMAADGLDEVILVLGSGELLAHFAQGNRQYLTIIKTNTQYITTDGTGCRFSFNDDLEIVYP